MNLRKRRRLNHTHPNYCTCHTVYMSTRSKQNSDQDVESSKRTVWSPDDEKALLSALLERKAEATNGTNFGPAVWNEVASSIGKPAKGAPKTAESCKSKWGRVSDSILIPSTIVDDSAIPRSKRPTRLSIHLQINLAFIGHLSMDLESRRIHQVL